MHHKISKLLNNSTALKFVRRKWIEVNDLLNGQYSTNKNIGLKTPMIRSDLCGYSDAYIDLNRTTNLKTGASNDMLRKEVKLENNAPCRPYITKYQNYQHIDRQCRRFCYSHASV